ncbi:Cysteine-rich receptor-like protein kinase 25, partial [Mucuna pruriens]
MALFSLKHNLLFTFLIFTLTEASDVPIYLRENCTTNETFTANTPFQSNLRILLSSLSSNATGNIEFYNITVSGGISPSDDTVYGLFLCRGDVPPQLCQQCVANATQKLSQASDTCTFAKSAIIWYDECLIRYSNKNFFSTVDTRPRMRLRNTANVSDTKSFLLLLYTTLNETADEAANSSDNGAKLYATKQARISGFQTLYCLTQCTPDLSPRDCRRCLSDVIGDLSWCCPGSQGGRVLYPSCNFRYELYPFYRMNSPPPQGIVNPTNSTMEKGEARKKGISSEIATATFLMFLFVLVSFLSFARTEAQQQGPTFLSQNCRSNETTANSTFQLNVQTLLSSLSSNATANNEFYNTTVAGRNSSDTVYGLFMCRGDVSFEVCGQCVVNATQRLSSNSECSLSKQAVIWYDECMVRYSNRSFFSTVDTRPAVGLWNSANISNQASFMSLMFDTMNETADEAANSSTGAEKYATNQANISGFQSLYCLVQCTQDLSPQGCRTCLSSAIGLLPWCCEGKQGGRILYPSCNVRYELYPFYLTNSTNTTSSPPTPTPTPSASAPPTPTNSSNSPGSSGISSGTIVAIVVPIVVAVLLFIVCIWLLSKRAAKKRNSARDPKNMPFRLAGTGTEISTVESLRFDFSTIEAATKKFSDANKLGEGGFGEVFKGLLPSGQVVAVKRLSNSSGQGGEEFKNEVEVVAKLQHRNLVRLLGFCLEGEEKILVYEFVANKSLDYILFDPEKQRSLDWTRRYKIVLGIARGIQYLHEDSRLKIIHRDLKASNVLLDEDMNPKISDFGMARIVEVDQTQANTNRIVGTYGYMSPEYAMHGEYSAKSDVYSFGVLVLEILSGKKNSSFYETDVAEDLLSYAWKLWKDEAPLQLMDHSLRESYTPNEAIRCIHIGLLCVQEDPADRPSMASIVLMLDSYSVTLPVPNQPAFFINSRTEPNMLKGLKIDQSTTNSTINSVNEMSVSEVDKYENENSFLFFPTKAAPVYSSHVCTDSSKSQPNITFQTNLNLLLSSLSSNATEGTHFYKTTIGSEAPNAVKGLFLCRGDTLPAACHDCVTTAANDLKHRCPVEKEAIIWYDVCMVRYSNQYLNNIVPGVDMSDSKEVARADLDRFNELLAGLLNALAEAANSADNKFATGEVNFTSSVTLYGLVQCTPELSSFDCNMCFRSAIAYVPNCCGGKRGARMLLPSCNIRYEVYPFYNSTKILAPPVVKSRPSGRSRVEVILTFVIPIVAAMVLFTFGICSVMRKQASSVIQLWRKT